MDFTVENNILNFTCTLDGHTLKAYGTYQNEYKELRFSVGDTCSVNFYTTPVVGVIKSFTEKYAVIEMRSSSKKVKLMDFISQNADTEVCFRIEKNSAGPYNCKEVSADFKKWVEKQIEDHQIRRWSGEKEHQPSMFEDLPLQSYAKHIDLFKFAFRNHEQLFNWFKLEEVQFMMREGFKIIAMQKGRDYVEALHSSYQSALILKPEDLEKIHSTSQTPQMVIPYY